MIYQYDSIMANQKRYIELIDISEELLKKVSRDILLNIDKDERLTSFEKLFVAFHTGFNKSHSELWSLYKNIYKQNMELKHKLGEKHEIQEYCI